MLVTNGGKHAVYNTFQTLLDPGDEVLLPAPYWTTYPETIALAGGVTVELPTTDASEFRVTVEQLEAARTPKTKALMFVSPSNPTGAVYPPDQVEARLPSLREQGDHVAGDALRKRGPAEHRRGGHGIARAVERLAITLDETDAAIFDDGDGEADHRRIGHQPLDARIERRIIDDRARLAIHRANGDADALRDLRILSGVAAGSVSQSAAAQTVPSATRPTIRK